VCLWYVGVGYVRDVYVFKYLVGVVCVCSWVG